MLDSILFTPIGIVHSPFKTREGMPIQSAAARDVAGTIELYEPYADGLKDLDGFSHIFVIYHFHLSKDYNLHVIPFMDTEYRGLFSTRAPRRPNPIGLSILRLEKVEGHILHVLDVDILDSTPLLDIKPYVTKIDVRVTQKEGWLSDKVEKLENTCADSRFVKR